MNLSFEPLEPDGSPRVFAGTHRPPWPIEELGHGYINCSCGAMIQTREGVRVHYDLGHFDRPLYEAREP